MPPSVAMPGGASLTGPTKPLSRRPDKAFVPPSGAMPGGALLTGPTKPLSRRPDKALAPPSGAMPGGASLTGPTKFTPVGWIRRLRRHPASCPVALCLPGLQNLSPVGRIRRLRRHPAPCRWRFAYRAYKIHSRRPDKALAPPSGVMPVALCLPGRQNPSPIGKKKASAMGGFLLRGEPPAISGGIYG